MPDHGVWIWISTQIKMNRAAVGQPVADQPTHLPRRRPFGSVCRKLSFNLQPSTFELVDHVGVNHAIEKILEPSRFKSGRGN